MGSLNANARLQKRHRPACPAQGRCRAKCPQRACRRASAHLPCPVVCQQLAVGVHRLLQVMVQLGDLGVRLDLAVGQFLVQLRRRVACKQASSNAAQLVMGRLKAMRGATQTRPRLFIECVVLLLHSICCGARLFYACLQALGLG